VRQLLNFVNPVGVVMHELEDVLTVKEVAEVLRCSKAHVCKIINGQVAGTPRLPSVSLGRRKLVMRSTLLRWLAENELDGTMASSLEVGAGRRA
jgi:excisionase family DNA binding protein